MSESDKMTIDEFLTDLFGDDEVKDLVVEKPRGQVFNSPEDQYYYHYYFAQRSCSMYGGSSLLSNLSGMIGSILTSGLPKSVDFIGKNSEVQLTDLKDWCGSHVWRPGEWY